MFEVIDKILSLDMGDRGVGHLYEPARASNKDALCLTAARLFMNLKAGEHVFLLTGSLTRNWVSKRIAVKSPSFRAKLHPARVRFGANLSSADSSKTPASVQNDSWGIE